MRARDGVKRALRIGALSCVLCAGPAACSTDGSAPAEPAGGTGGMSGPSGGAAGDVSSAGNTSSGTGGSSLAGAGGSGNGGGSGAASAGAAGTAPVGGGVGGIGAGGSGGSAGSGGGANGCEAVEAVYCNDFEQQTDGQAPSGDFSVDDNIVVDSTEAYSGTKSVRVTTEAPGDSTVMTFTSQELPSDFHGRLMVKMTQTPANNSHWDLVILRGGGYDWELGGMYGNFELVVDPPDDGIDSDTEFPTGRWFCLQWQFNHVEGGDNTYLAMVDGAPVDPGEISGRWQAGAWQSLRVGFIPYQNSDVDIEIWIDDLAFGDQPIPCPL